MTADFGNVLSESVSYAITVPAALVVRGLTSTPPQPPIETEPAAAPMAWYEKVFTWARENKTVALISGVALGLGTIGLSLFGIGSFSARRARLAELARRGAGRPGRFMDGLDMLGRQRFALPPQTTNVRIGRHCDNDICLLNDSISRRHAVLHFDADKRRFVISRPRRRQRCHR
jgi:hypothetical protein